ncbi:type IV pilus inner membrane component PilO [Thioalkalivibrio paradoxus]|uniref:Pilus assembly protein PilO n=1 Tax=Thioalkalivibrio paradoxus ARh 1 TaxID=713585 RepID=W0DR68_9GAMM|nr:type 4a pilus biogenesis protein PilO [Thioalkalivibrio paradoxus]AHE99350.1 pilus assembly protein PilO [Thioalkalivibrio paradoxus ARh 1]
MDLKSINEIDFRNLGEAPAAVKGVIIALIIVALAGAGYWYFIKDQVEVLDREERREVQLRAEFEEKQERAANLAAYEEQLAEMERMFASLVQLLPSTAEIPNLLVDISQTALSVGLEIELFQPRGEANRTFYAEVPIQLRVRGTYEQLAEFVSGISAMPRIVTVHDVYIRPGASDDDLLMDAIARTYRYLEGT